MQQVLGVSGCRGVCACNYLKDDAVINYATFSFHSNVSFFIAFQRAQLTHIYPGEERVEESVVASESRERRPAQAQCPATVSRVLRSSHAARWMLTCGFLSVSSVRILRVASAKAKTSAVRLRFIIKSQ